MRGVMPKQVSRPIWKSGGRLVGSLGAKNYMILRHHGLLACGATAAEALFRMSLLQRACEVQVTAAAFGENQREIPEEVLRKTTRQMQSAVAKGSMRKLHLVKDSFVAYRRQLDAADARYRD